MSEEELTVRSVCLGAWGAEPEAWTPTGDPAGPQYASSLIKGTATLRVPMIIKVQPPEEGRRAALMSDSQFHNEVSFYKEILPILGVSELTPRMYLGVATRGAHPERDVLALSVLQGFEASKQRPFLDLQHCLITLEALGRFHAASFSKKDRDLIRQKASALEETGFSRRDSQVYGVWMKACFGRGIDSVPSPGPDVERLSREVDRRLVSIVELLDGPADPDTSVLLHGDFCANNLMFRYDGGTPREVRLLDFQNARWGGPSLDLSFFLYLNTSQQLRSSHFDTLLDCYLNSLEKHLPLDSLYPGRERIVREFASNALYGFMHCSFFLPVMMCPTPPSWGGELDPSSPESVAFALSVGGQEATRALADIIGHLSAKGYLDSFFQRLDRS